MKAINNKKGSAILWTVLLAVIITILLGAVMTATYAYFNYTMYSVKRQQAYFTARSATNALIDEFSDQEQDASGNDLDPDILPARNSFIDITDFGLPAEMGTAVAKLERGNGDEVDITVTAKYADEEYVIKSTVMRQPLYFAGIAIKDIVFKSGSLKLGDNTDLYWNNTATFTSQTASGGKIDVSGNLVTKGDALIRAGSKIAGHEFKQDVTFSKAGDSKYRRKIWNPYSYVISNKTLQVNDAGENGYSSTVINTLKNISNYTLKYCNNSVARMPSSFGGYPTSGGLSGLLNLIGLGNVFNDLQENSLKLTDSNNKALAIRYIKILSLSQTIDNAAKKYLGNGLLSQIYQGLLSGLIQDNGLRVLDTSYIGYTSTDMSSYSDNVIPIVYLFVKGGTAGDPGSTNNGLTVRVQYGRDPDSASGVGQLVDNVGNLATGFISDVFNIHSNLAYVIVYLEPYSTIELGCKLGTIASKRTPTNLVFAYSIYGDVGSKVILNDGVTVLGEVYCDELEINGNAQIIYSNSNGSQVAKQKVAEYWSVVNYSD